MRELKFRVWDKEKSLYLDREALKGIAASFDGTIMYYGAGTYWEDKDLRFILEQFTGFQDSEWNDIYEGDILDGLYPNTIHEVYRDNIYVSFIMKCVCDRKVHHEGFLDSNANILTIIGNINENSELLK